MKTDMLGRWIQSRKKYAKNLPLCLIFAVPLFVGGPAISADVVHSSENENLVLCDTQITKFHHTDLVKYYCLPNLQLRKVDIFAVGTHGSFLQRRYFFGENSTLQKKQFFKFDGQLEQEDLFDPIKDDIYRKNPAGPTYVLEHIRRYDRVKFSLKNLSEQIIQMDYWRQDGDHWKLYIQDFLGTTEDGPAGHIQKRLIYKESGNFEVGYRFYFDSLLPYVQIVAIDVLNEKGDVLTKFNQKNTGIRGPFQLLHSRLLEQGSEKKKPIVLIDSGFDSNNSKLVSRMGLMPNEVIDNLDNDGDNWVDNFAGYIFDPTRELNTGHVTAIPSFSGSLNTPYPFCHGTHVGDLFTRDLKKNGLIPFGGDFTKPAYLKNISSWIEKNKVKFVNMSFDFGSYNNSDNPLSMGLPVDSNFELEQMVQRNSKTLFVIAAGNGGGVNLDVIDNFPARIKSQNKIVVAAVNTSDIDEKNLSNYKLTGFSNLGENSVDIAAPGYKVIAWNFGNHRIPLSGTSMASPIVGNVAVKIDEIDDSLTIQEIKEILMKTVYIHRLDRPLPVRSGGIMIEKRALLAAELLRSGKAKTIEAACLQARKEKPLPNELVGTGEEQLVEFWRKRGL